MKKILAKYRDVPDPESSPKETRPFRTFHVPQNQFDIENGRVACTCISIIAVQYFLRSDVAPVEFDWPSVLSKGATIFMKWKERNPTKIYPHAFEVYDMLLKGGGANQIHLRKDLSGHLIESRNAEANMPVEPSNGIFGEELNTQSFVTLGNAISEMLCCTNSALTFTIHESTISMCPSRHDDYKGIWLYDSHYGSGHDRLGSDLLLFRSKMDLVQHITAAYYLPNPTRQNANIFYASLFVYEKPE
jgi:hypothetical protein